MKHIVSLRAASDYQPDTLLQQLRLLLEPLGGMHAFVKPGQKVLLKPNMLSGKPPEQAVSVRGEVYQLGAHRLSCGDSTNADDVARLMDGEQAAMTMPSSLCSLIVFSTICCPGSEQKYL